MDNEKYEPRLFTEEEIEDMAAEVQPILAAVAELTKKYNINTGFISATAWNDGTVYFNGTGLSGWRITRDSDGMLSIDYSYTKNLHKEDNNNE